MERNTFDTPESSSATRNPVNDSHLYYPAADVHSIDEDLPVHPSERLVQSDKLYVGNLPPEISIVDLHKAFKKFGQISDIQLPYNTGPGGKPKGYAFILFKNWEDAARAQVKLDGAILSKRIVKVDFAHQEKLNPILKNRKPAKDAAQVTTLSMLKGSQHTRSTQEQITLAESKLRQLSRPDNQQEGSKSSFLLHPSLPPKPSPIGFEPVSHSSMTPNANSSLPSLPLASSSKPHVRSAMKKVTISRPAAVSSTSLAPSTKKIPRLTGIKIIKKMKDNNVRQS